MTVRHRESATVTLPSHANSKDNENVTEKPSKEFTLDEVAKHNSSDDCWLICDGCVYDVSKFLSRHPGGPDIILKYGGKDVTIAMRDDHLHTISAFTILETHLIGTVKGVSLKNKQVHFKKDPVDYTKATLWQVGKLGADYDVWVHTAVCPENGTVRLFETEFMEKYLTHTNWYLVPIFWVPLVLYFAYSCVSGSYGEALSLKTLGILYSIGVFAFTLIEYFLHRVIFHTVPTGYWMITLHYLLHGLHHKSPMEKGRLVLPPALFCLFATPIVSLVFALVPGAYACGLVSGGITGYILYDMSHYYVHHNTPSLSYLKELKTYHMRHHYEDYEIGFGVSSKLWDLVFHTELPPVM